MHLQDAANALLFAFRRVENVRTGSQCTGVNPEERKTAHEGVCHDFERQCGERQFVAGSALIFFAGIGVNAFDRRNIQRRRHVIHNAVQERLYAFVLVRRTAENRSHFASNGRFTNAGFNFFLGQLFAFQVLHHQLVVAFRHCIQKRLAIFFRLLLHVFGNLGSFAGFAEVVRINDGLHVDEVYKALKGVFEADRQLQRHRMGAEAAFHHIHNTEEIRAENIHFVNIGHTRHAVLVSLPPHRFRLGLNATLGAENGYRAVQYAQGTLHFYREVHVTRCVNDVDAMIIPLAGSSSRGNGNPTLLLLYHPVHGRSAIMHFADFVYPTGIEKDAFSSSGFAGVDMCHDADVPCFLKRKLTGHCFHSLS